MSGMIDLSLEKLARRAPVTPLPLGGSDWDYIQEQLRILGEAFSVPALPARPLAQLPGREVVRHCIALKASLKPASPEQYLAYGRIQSVFRLLTFACDLVRDRAGQSSSK